MQLTELTMGRSEVDEQSNVYFRGLGALRDFGPCSCMHTIAVLLHPGHITLGLPCVSWTAHLLPSDVTPVNTMHMVCLATSRGWSLQMCLGTVTWACCGQQ